LILVDTLIKQFEVRGYAVQADRDGGDAELVLNEGTVGFRLAERTKRVAPPPKPPRKSGSRHEPSFDHWQPAYILVGTGEFTLEFDKYQLPNCRHTWKDLAKSRVEDRLHEVMEAIPSWEAVQKRVRIEREEFEAQQRRAEQRRIANARANEVLRQQRTRLVNNLLSWERAERLRRFVQAVEQAGSDDPKVIAWLGWAAAQIRTLDPLPARIPEVIDLDVALPEYFTGHSTWDKIEKGWWG
jgi:hypothetical protein